MALFAWRRCTRCLWTRQRKVLCVPPPFIHADSMAAKIGFSFSIHSTATVNVLTMAYKTIQQTWCYRLSCYSCTHSCSYVVLVRIGRGLDWSTLGFSVSENSKWKISSEICRLISPMKSGCYYQFVAHKLLPFIEWSSTISLVLLFHVSTYNRDIDENIFKIE